MSLASVPRESSGHNERPLMAAQAAPASAGDSRLCHGFCQRENKQNNIITLYRTTSAKTRATATLRQRHIPPNVIANCKKQLHMKKLLIIMIATISMAGNCEHEGPDCHFSILVINTSNKDIVCAKRFVNTSNECILSGSIIKPSENQEIRLNDCWEKELANGRTEELYIVDPDHYNQPTVFYECDLIETNNTVLKHYSLTLDVLKNSDFIITYP